MSAEQIERIDRAIQGAALQELAKIKLDGDIFVHISPQGVVGNLDRPRWRSAATPRRATSVRTRCGRVFAQSRRPQDVPERHMRARHFAVWCGHATSRVAFVSPPFLVDEEFLARSLEFDASPESRFRFATTCVEERCRQWTGTRCGVIDDVLNVAVPTRRVEQELPRCEILLVPVVCTIRPSCLFRLSVDRGRSGGCQNSHPDRSMTPRRWCRNSTDDWWLEEPCRRRQTKYARTWPTTRRPARRREAQADLGPVRRGRIRCHGCAPRG